jgi:predicted nucleotidyltransferase
MSASLSRQTILRELEKHARELSGFGVRRIGLFGSYLRDSPGPGSDLDFLVELRRPSFDDYMDTKLFLEDLFGRKVDLVTDKALKPALRHVRDEAAYPAMS